MTKETMTDETRRSIALLLADDDPNIRRAAAEDLSEAPTVAPVAALAAALQDESKGVRDAASRSLCAIGGINVARAIVEYIGNVNIITRNLAAELLVKLGATSVPAVIHYLQDKNQDVRKFTVDILGTIGSSEASAHLLPLLDDPDPNVVVSTVEALGNIKSVESLPGLFQIYERAEYTKAAVMEALGKIHDERAGEFLLTRLRGEIGVSTQDPVTLFTIIESLGLIGNAKALHALLAQVHAVRGKLRSALLHAIVQIAARVDEPLVVSDALKADLVRALRDDDVGIQISAAKWLGSWPDGEVTVALIDALGVSPDLDAIVQSLLAGRSDAFAIASERLAPAKASQRTAITSLMGRLAFEYVQKIIRHENFRMDEKLFTGGFDSIANTWASADEEARGAIVDALFRLDGDRAIKFLDAIMNDPDPWLRMHVIEIIAAISDPRAPEFITRFLQDDDKMVRELAAGTLQAKGYIVDGAEIGELE